MQITKWYDKAQFVYKSKKGTIREVVIEAISSDANLSGANLRGANLRDANLRDANLSGAEFMHVRFYGKGGSTKITKTQVEAFHAALGVVVTD